MMGFGMGGFGSLLLLALVGFGIYYFVRDRDLRSRAGDAGREHSRDTALDLLRERYARGEIDQAEFDERRHQLVRTE